jgi:hypothetical protein
MESTPKSRKCQRPQVARVVGHGPKAKALLVGLIRSSPASQVPHLPLRLRRSCAGIQQVRSLDLSLLAGQQIEPCSKVWWRMQILLNRSCDEYQFHALALLGGASDRTKAEFSPEHFGVSVAVSEDDFFFSSSSSSVSAFLLLLLFFLLAYLASFRSLGCLMPCHGSAHGRLGPSGLLVSGTVPVSLEVFIVR